MTNDIEDIDLAKPYNLHKTTSVLPYVYTTIILFISGLIFIALVLFLRPTLDPLIVITSVMGFVITISTGIAAFIKAQETHNMVNSKLDAWKKEVIALALAQGKAIGIIKEQERVAEQLKIKRESDKT
jgi:membrane-bound ClpP family serine protease